MSDDAEFRARHVGASEVSALFDANPWVTRFELWHRKAGNIDTPDFGGNERIEWGIRLEPVIIEAACDRWGYQRREGKGVLTNGNGFGGHPDAPMICPERGPGIVETKCVDWLVVKGWGEEPPLHYLLQGNSYAGLDRVAWFDLVVLVGGNELRRFQYDFRPRLFDECEKRVADFWQSVRDGQAPPADYGRDLSAIAEINAGHTDRVADLSADNFAADAAARYLRAKEARAIAEGEIERAEAELREKIGDASRAQLAGFMASMIAVKPTPDREITPDMVGEIIKGRRGYRRLQVKELN